MAQAKIAIVGGDLDGTEFVLKPGENRIGRVVENEIVLRHRSISRRHAVIHAKDGEYSIEDLGSHNGIEFNGTRVQQCPLMHGLQFKLGDFQVLFLEGGASKQLSGGPKSKALAKNQPEPQSGGNWEELFDGPKKKQQEEEAPVVDAQPVGEIEAMDLFGEAQPEINLGDKEDSALARISLILYLIVLVGILCFGFYLLHQQTLKGLWEPSQDYILKKGEVRVLAFTYGYEDYYLGNEDDEHEVAVEPMKFIPQNENESKVFIKIKAIGPGMAEIISKPRGEKIRVIVMGNMKEETVPDPEIRMSDAQRLHQGRLLIRSGRSHLNRLSYAAAWQDFKKAERLLRPFRASENFDYRDAQQKVLECENLIDEEVKKLKAEYQTARENTDREIANRLLERILLLLPDPKDPQHQMTGHILAIRRRR